ncbi:glycine cleavage system H protein [Perkinsela sp. CCAP 1560/4]|nr:glycine cleavage system H protein [Perkinsela sp. CCAP 1560/4]|eukprot:KNH04972.1 glycine cleavage system H protein [Perkinsela sp. CCAP 1560/4]
MISRTQLRRYGQTLAFFRTPLRLQVRTLYTASHEWVAYDASTKVATIGISHHAQEQFGTVVYADLPEKGEKVQVDKPCGNVESVKATSEITSPVDGVISEVNAQVQENPSLLNDSPEKDGWLLKVRDASFEETALMTPEKYIAFVEKGEKA